MKAGIYQCYDGTLLYVAKDRMIKAFTSCVFRDEWTGEVLDAPILVTTSNREQCVSFGHNGRDVEAKRIDNVPNGCTDPLRALSKVSYSMLLGRVAEHMRTRGEGEHLVDYVYSAHALKWIKKSLLRADCSMCGESVCDECGPTIGAADAATVAGGETAVIDFKADLVAPYDPTGVKEQLNFTPASGGSVDYLKPEVQGRRFALATTSLEALKRCRDHFNAQVIAQGFRLCRKGSAKNHRKQGPYVLPLGDGFFAWRPKTDHELAATLSQRAATSRLRLMGVFEMHQAVALGKTRTGRYEK